MTWYAVCGIAALCIAVCMSLTRSKLSLFVLGYLVGLWVIQSISSELHPEGLLKLFPTVPLIIIFQWFALTILDKTHIRARITPIVIGFAMLFESACITEDILGLRFFFYYYGIVLGVTSLLAALEGAYYGGVGILGKSFVGDRRVGFHFSWLSQSLQVIKKD